MKTAKNRDTVEFLDMALKQVSGLTCLINQTGNMKRRTTKNRENDEFLDMPLKHGSDLVNLVNRPGTLKFWEMANENGQIWRQRQVCGHASVLVNRPGILKPWVIPHENGQNWRKRRVFGHPSQTFIGSYLPCKSHRNPKTMGNSS